MRTHVIPDRHSSCHTCLFLQHTTTNGGVLPAPLGMLRLLPSLRPSPPQPQGTYLHIDNSSNVNSSNIINGADKKQKSVTLSPDFSVTQISADGFSGSSKASFPSV